MNHFQKAVFQAFWPNGWLALLVAFSFVQTLNAQGPAGRSCNTVDPPVTHWSTDLKFGPGYASSSGFEANLGGSIEYSFNPFAGFGLQALYGIRQDALNVLGYGSLNLSNLTAPFRTGHWKQTNVFFVAGGGLRQAGSTSMLILAGLDGEYNLNDELALEMGGDLLYGLDKGVHVTIGLRYKFGVSYKKHARNISMNEYRPQPSPIQIRQTVWVDNAASSMKRLEAIERSNDSLQISLQATEEAIKTYKGLLASQDASRAATKAVSKPTSKPSVAFVPVSAVAIPGPSAVSGVPISAVVVDTAVAVKPAVAAVKPVVVAVKPEVVAVKPDVVKVKPEIVKVKPALVAVTATDTALATVKQPTAISAPVTKTPPIQLKVANVVTGTMNPVEFLPGSSQLTPDSKLILNEMASILLTKDWISMIIIGNTDNQGDPISNKILSLKRAVIVRDYLVTRGLGFKKLKVRGDGGSNPIDSNKTPLGRRLNRRVDFQIL